MSTLKQPELLDCVALLHDRLDVGLVAGQTGTIVHDHGDGAYEVEFTDTEGHTYALETFRADELLRLVHTPEVAA